MSSDADTDSEQKKIEVLCSAETPTQFSDRVMVNRRSDGLFLLRWLFQMPEGQHVEGSRIVVAGDHLKRIVDVLCKLCQYYPTPPDEEEDGKAEASPDPAQ